MSTGVEPPSETERDDGPDTESGPDDVAEVEADEEGGIAVEYAPAFTSAAISVGAGVVAVLLGGLTTALALVFGVLGLGLLAGSVFVTESRRGVSLGTFGIFVGVVIGGVFGSPAELLLPAMVATIVAWDVGHTAIVVGRQLGRGDFTRRLEVVHAGSSVLVGVVTAGVAYVAFVASVKGVPAAAVILLLFASAFLAWAIRT